MPVFCKNCKYFNPWIPDLIFHEATCGKIVAETRISPVHGYSEWHYTPNHPDYPNKDSKCRHYKRKWWKFWAEESFSCKVEPSEPWPAPPPKTCKKHESSLHWTLAEEEEYMQQLRNENLKSTKNE